METIKLEKGMVIKNYRAMCKLLGEEVKCGSSKRSQIKEWKRYINYHIEGQKQFIDEIYDIPKEIIDNRKDNGGGHNRHESPNFLIPEENENNIGVYKIVLDNNIYVGSTIVSFRHRYTSHKGKNNSVPFTTEMLFNGATFEILEECEGMTEIQIRTKENKYIEFYKNNDNWILVNTNSAWCNAKVIKKKYKKITIEESNYEKAFKLLRENKLIS